MWWMTHLEPGEGVTIVEPETEGAGGGVHPTRDRKTLSHPLPNVLGGRDLLNEVADIHEERGALGYCRLIHPNKIEGQIIYLCATIL